MTAPAAIYCSILFVSNGHNIAIWSPKAKVWVRLQNRYVKLQDAQRAVDIYGFVLWTMPGQPPSDPTAYQREGT